MIICTWKRQCRLYSWGWWQTKILMPTCRLFKCVSFLLEWLVLYLVNIRWETAVPQRTNIYYFRFYEMVNTIRDEADIRVMWTWAWMERILYRILFLDMRIVYCIVCVYPCIDTPRPLCLQSEPRNQFRFPVQERNRHREINPACITTMHWVNLQNVHIRSWWKDHC